MAKKKYSGGFEEYESKLRRVMVSFTDLNIPLKKRRRISKT